MPNNLPLQLTSFVGREREMAAVKERLEQSRLVTLTGAGGCGKTRLALQVASDALDAYPDGTWVIDLAPLSDEALVPHAVLAALGVAEAPGRPILDQLIDVLAPRRVLLVLDNCEHLVEGCARLVHVLLHACPRLTILATSREMLGVAGEAAWRVPSLALPDSIPSRSSAATLSPSATMRAAAVARQSQLDPEALLAYEGVRLFVERAALVQSEFTLTRENAPAVLEICRRLDGMPLALELAAARVRVLSVEQIAERLTDRFRLLTGGSRTALRRQQTLRALIDWSYDLLGEPERALLRRLAVFAGGWTLDAAEQVCATGDRAIQDYEVLDLLTELVDKSLVVAEAQAEQGGEAHYRLLETVRQYAEEKLLDAGEAEVVRTRHAAYYTELAEEAAPQLRRHDAVQWMERLRREHDNLRGALQWAEATGNAEQGLQAAGALHIFWQAIHRTEGRAWIERLLALPGESVRPATRGRALRALSVVAALLRDAAGARAAADEALRLAEQADDQSERAAALLAVGYVAFIALVMRGDEHDAGRILEESRRVAHDVGDRSIEVRAMSYRARVLAHAGDRTGAVRLADETLALARELGVQEITIWMLLLLAGDALERDDRARSRELGEEALAMAGEWDAAIGASTSLRAWALGALAQVDFADDDFATGGARYREALRIFLQLDETTNVARVLGGLGTAAAGLGQWPRALRLISSGAALRSSLGARPAYMPWYAARVEQAIETARRALGEPAASAAWQAGETMRYEEAVAYALADENQPPAVLEAPRGRTPRTEQAVAALEVDAVTHEVRVGGQPLPARLSAHEFQLLSYLYQERPRVCTRQELGDAIWGAHAWDVNMLHGLIRRLKEKLEPDPSHPRYVVTVPQVGYRLEAAPAVAPAA